MEKMLKGWLFALGFNITRQTEASDVMRVIERLRPQQCGRELIRVGGDGDGGYLIPDDLDGIEYCFSPGVSDRSHFENQLADRGIRSFLADFSVTGPAVDRPEFTFDKMFVGALDKEDAFTLNAWKQKYLAHYSGELILQMDIEGAEYETILSTPAELLNQFRILVFEFHHLDKLFDRFGFRLIKACFDKLLDSFHVVHLHPNNCCGAVKRAGIEVPRVMEMTFLNKRRAVPTGARRDFPHRLDCDNVQTRAPLNLPQCWFGE